MNYQEEIENSIADAHQWINIMHREIMKRRRREYEARIITAKFEALGFKRYDAKHCSWADIWKTQS